LANAIPLDLDVGDLDKVSGWGSQMGIWNLIRRIGGMFPTVFWWSSPHTAQREQTMELMQMMAKQMADQKK
jgi:hypothetical protein